MSYLLHKGRVVEADDDAQVWQRNYRWLDVHRGDKAILLYISYMLTVDPGGNWWEFVRRSK